MSVCLCVCPSHTGNHAFRWIRDLVEGHIANIGISLDVFEFSRFGWFFPFFKKKWFWVFLVHPTVVSVLLSASVERCFVSRMRHFYIKSYEKMPFSYFFLTSEVLLYFYCTLSCAQYTYQKPKHHIQSTSRKSCVLYMIFSNQDKMLYHLLKHRKKFYPL